MLPGVDRLTLSAFLKISSNGKVVHSRFAETVIRSRRRLTYNEATRILRNLPDSSNGSTDRNKPYDPVPRMLWQAEQAMQLLLQRRQRQGSLDFDIPSGEILLDNGLQMTGIRRVERTTAHRMIEEFMIAANVAAAQELERHEIPALHRVHEAPRAAALEKLRSLLRPFGIGLPEDMTLLDPAGLREVLLSVEGRPEEGLIGTLILRSLSRAIYEPRSKGHFALSKRYYTHFTSPIRRYPDLLVHRQLKALLRRLHSTDLVDESSRAAVTEAENRDDLGARLPGIGQHCSAMERRAETAERELRQWKTVRFLANRVGDEFEGEITGVHRSGLFVYLKDCFADGFIPARSLGDGDYRLDEQLQSLVAERGQKSYRLGDAVKVRLVELNERRRSLDLRPLSVEASRPRPAKRRPRRRSRRR